MGGQAKGSGGHCLPPPFSELISSWIKSEQHASANLIAVCRGGDVLGAGVHIAKAALDPAAFVERATTAGVVHETDGLGRRLRGLRAGEPQERAPAWRSWET